MVFDKQDNHGVSKAPSCVIWSSGVPSPRFEVLLSRLSLIFFSNLQQSFIVGYRYKIGTFIKIVILLYMLDLHKR